MAKIRVTQVKSVIDRPKRQKATMKALGLTRMQKTVEVEATPQVMGMIDKVKHLVTIQEA